MKKSFLTLPALGLTLALALSACGGKASFPMDVTVHGLQYGNLVVTTNGQDLSIAPPKNTGDTVTATFAKSIDYGETYNIIPKTQPPHQRCVPPDYDSVTDSPIKTWTDTAGHLSSINIHFVCSIIASTIGGDVDGLTEDGLVLINGSTGGTVTIPKDAKKYVFPYPVAYNVSYGVSVLTNPENLICRVENPSGVMNAGKDKDENVENINVKCDPKQN